MAATKPRDLTPAGTYVGTTLSNLWLWRGLCRGKTSVCPSARLTDAGILSKRLNISSKFFHHLVARPFRFFHAKLHSNILKGTPYRGRRMQRGMKNRHFRPISCFGNDRAIVTMEDE